MTHRGSTWTAFLARQMLCLCAGCWLTVAAIAAETAGPEGMSPAGATTVTVTDGMVSGTLEQVPLAAELEAIGRQAGFTYSAKPWLAEEPVSGRFDGLPVYEALTKLLEGFNYTLETGPDGAIAVLRVTGLGPLRSLDPWLPAAGPVYKEQRGYPRLRAESVAAAEASMADDGGPLPPVDRSAGPPPLPVTAPASWDRDAGEPTDDDDLDWPGGNLPRFRVRVVEGGPGGPDPEEAPDMLTIDRMADEVWLAAVIAPENPLPPFEPVYSDTGPGDPYTLPQTLPVFNASEGHWEFLEE